MKQVMYLLRGGEMVLELYTSCFTMGNVMTAKLLCFYQFNSVQPTLPRSHPTKIQSL